METPEITEIVAKLREYLLAEHRRGMTYKSLGKLAGLTGPEVSRIVHVGTVTESRLRAAAIALGLVTAPPAAQTPPTAHPVQTGEAK